MSEEIALMNQRLKDSYGTDVATGLPNYRLVWSSDQYEYRNNDPAGFEIYGDNGIWLRTEYGPHKVEKYPLYSDMWVLETLLEKSEINKHYLPDWEKFSYEPLWIFGAGNSYPKPVWSAVNFLAHGHKFKLAYEARSDKDVLRDEAVKLAREKEECKTYLRNENPLLAAQLHAGEAVVVPNKEFGGYDPDG